MTTHLQRIPMAAVALVGLFAVPVYAQTVVGSKHDLRAAGGGTAMATGLVEVCASCHTPHQTATAASQDPLWNHTATATAVFGVYTSTTMNATPAPAEIGGAALGTQSVSLLCMSCHDGTVSVLSMYNAPNSGAGTILAIAGRINATGQIISPANMGIVLTDDHPVNFNYDAALVTADPGLRAVNTLPATVPLFAGKVQCATCHDVHNPLNAPFLTISNTASALCTTCHIK